MLLLLHVFVYSEKAVGYLSEESQTCAKRLEHDTVSRWSPRSSRVFAARSHCCKHNVLGGFAQHKIGEVSFNGWCLS